MQWYDGDFVDFMGYVNFCEEQEKSKKRNYSSYEDDDEYVVVHKDTVRKIIEEAVDACVNGSGHFSFDKGELTDEEVEYIKKQVARRTGFSVS